MSQSETMLTRPSIPTRYSLLGRLQNWDDQDSWKEFFETYWRFIYAVAIKSGLTEAEAQDVVQETIISVSKDLHKFQRDRRLGSFKGWLRNLIRWRIADQLRKRMRAGFQEQSTTGENMVWAAIKDIPDEAGESAESAWEAEWQNNLLEVAVESVKRRVKEEHYQIFDLCVHQQWPVKKIARELNVNVGYVYLAKHRITALLKKEVRRLQAAGW